MPIPAIAAALGPLAGKAGAQLLASKAGAGAAGGATKGNILSKAVGSVKSGGIKPATGALVGAAISLGSHIVNKRKMDKMKGTVMFNEQEIGRQARVGQKLRQIDTGIAAKPVTDAMGALSANLMSGVTEAGGSQMDRIRAYRNIMAETGKQARMAVAEQRKMYEPLFEAISRKVVGREENIQMRDYLSADAQKTMAQKDFYSNIGNAIASVGGGSSVMSGQTIAAPSTEKDTETEG